MEKLFSERNVSKRMRLDATSQPELPLYPIDASLLLSPSYSTIDKDAVLSSATLGDGPAAYHPTGIAQYALACWNIYLAGGNDEWREGFMAQANWFLEHEMRFTNGASGWPIPSILPEYHVTRPWLSAAAQGSSISVCVRAYQLTGQSRFLEAAVRAVRTFELDILDGGVSTQCADDSLFFQEVAAYPAAYVLKGYILSIFGLYDYVAITQDSAIEQLIQRSLATFHEIIDEFDTGYWSRCDLLHKRLASPVCHTLHIMLIRALSCYTGCEHCAELALRWEQYQRRVSYRLRYFAASRTHRYWSCGVVPKLRRFIFGVPRERNQAPGERICVPIKAFPVAGGTRGVLAGVQQVMDDRWKVVYLTHRTGLDTRGLEIKTFGTVLTHPWQFPFVWLYFLAGCCRLFSLLRHSTYKLILPQDGVFTGAFAALVGKIAGLRVVCMDHGNVTLLDSPAFRSEYLKSLEPYPWLWRVLSHLRLAMYWPSQRLLARIATHFTDLFLIAGDEVEAVYRKDLGVRPDRVVRYAYMLDASHFTPLDRVTRAEVRVEQGVPEDAILITLINRLAIEKGLDCAVEGIAQALLMLPAEVRSRVRVLIVGDGPLRSQVEADIRRHGLDAVCRLWGEAAPPDVVKLLGIADIFLYSGTRGTNYSMAVLEAMAAGCAVIASVVPQSNARLLAEGRGIAVEPGSSAAISQALVRLCCDLALCRQVGRLAREYVEHYHNAQILLRSLLRASYFAPVLVEQEVKAQVSAGDV